MKKNFIYLVNATLLVLVLCGPAAATGLYIGILGGGSFAPEAKATDADGSVNFSYDAGFDGCITLGYDLLCPAWPGLGGDCP